jgi:alanyl-tRNA synthetase
MELSRILTRSPDRVAILGGNSGGQGLLFVGSSAGSVDAQKLLAAARATFAGKGGGNPSAATAVGDPGAPLQDAIARAARAVGAPSAE